MMDNEAVRPDPDELLKSLERVNARKKGGRLKIFLGMAAGVGKTYAMLEAAHTLLKDGSDVAAGVVETHGRAETMRLLENIPLIPPKKVAYREREFLELDIDAILARKPEFALVDELAHTNIPGSRHEKRWQDIMELLDHGINVYSTLNIQHVESRKEDVELATGISMRETVPDSVIERAEQIELIDIPPETLLERLAEGKVYLGDKAGRAAQNFFRQDKLTALRELALRFAGDVVGSKLHELSVELSSSGGREKLLVAVSHSPHSRRLIRAARKMAFAAEADWIALHVDTGTAVSQEDGNRLSENIELARTLGAAVLSTTDSDLVAGIARIARQHGVTKVLVGRPQPGWGDWFGPSFLDRLLASSNTDVQVLHNGGPVPEGKAGSYAHFPHLAGKRPYQSAVLLIAAATILGELAAPVLSYQSIGFIYMLAVLTAGAFFTVGPILLSAVLSALAWNFFFIPPRYTFAITRAEDALMCVTFFLAAAITGLLSHRIARSGRLLRDKESSNEAMLDVLAQFAFRPNRKECLEAVAARMSAFFKGSFEIVFAKNTGSYETTSSASSRLLSSQREWAVARWTLDNGKEAGWSTDTLSSSRALYVPLIAHGKITGVLAYVPRDPDMPLGEEARSLLLALSGQLAFYLEQEMYREQAQAANDLKRSEKLYQAILSSVSHEIKTPITAIIGLVSALEDEKIVSDNAARQPILHELSEAAERLNTEVSNILDMSRLSSGLIDLKKEWFDARELAEACAVKAGRRLEGRALEVKVEEGLPFLHADYVLMEQVVSNIISNSLNYTGPDSRIELDISRKNDKIEIRIGDSGSGIPPEYLEKVFERFFRVPGTPAGGTGLGLAIAKTVVDLHNGSISAANRPGGGAEFVIALPVEPQPQLEDK
jgi:two-component system sensor histidine kinase KdpD